MQQTLVDSDDVSGKGDSCFGHGWAGGGDSSMYVDFVHQKW